MTSYGWPPLGLGFTSHKWGGRWSRWLWLLVGLLAASGHLKGEPSSDNQLIYSQQLNNGWQDWGWVTHYATNSLPAATNSPPAGLTNCMVFAATGGYQAWWLVHDPINTALYTNLTFWVNGGTTGGQYVGVQALGPTNTPRLSVTAPKNGWQAVTFSLAALGVANVTNLTGIQIWNASSAQPNFFLANLALTAVSPPSLVKVTVNVTNHLRTVDARLFGSNLEAWDGSVDTTNTVDALVQSGNLALRWPGGSWGDSYFMTNELQGWGSRTTNFLHVATNTGAQIYFIVNYGSGSPAQAADWVRFCNITNRCYVKYWEVGNEVGGSWEEDINTNPPYLAHDAWSYAQRFTSYYNQMKAVDPTIKIGAVADITEDGTANYTNHPVVNPVTGVTHNGWTPVMLTYMRSNGITPDFLIEHKYAPNDGDAYNLQWTSTWAGDGANLRKMLTDYLGAAGTNVELDCTEHGAGSDRQRVSLVGGLFLADSLGAMLQTEFNARLWWCFRNGQNSVTNSDNALYGWRTNASGYFYFDEGWVTGTAYATNRYPNFYCQKLLQYFARGGDAVVLATNNSLWLGTYAVQRADGMVTLLVINKSCATNLTAAIKVLGYTPATNGVFYSYGMAQDTAAQTGYGLVDIATNTLSGAGTNFNFVFPAYSATVLALQPSPPRLVVQPGPLSPGQFVWQIWGQSGVPYIIQSTSHLNGIWNSVATNVLTGPFLTVTNTVANPTRPAFYRVVWQP